MESATQDPRLADHGALGEGFSAGEKGLKTGALGLVSNVVIAVASAAPAYSLAATLGLIVAVKGVGLSSPAVLIVSFIPMLLIAVGYRYLNRVDPDCGTTFAWTTRAFGPKVGFLGGWGLVLADVIVMANLAQIAGTYTFLLFRATPSTFEVTLVGVAWIVLMTFVTYRGIELSARLQNLLLSLEVLILSVFAVVALVKLYANHPPHSVDPSLSWFNPFAISSPGAMIDGVLLALFIYWGWDTGVAVNEESAGARENPGKAAVLSTVLLLLIYVVVATAAQGYGGTAALNSNSSDVLGYLGGKVFPRPLDLLLILAVLTSASACTQTTILPAARTGLSMARWGAIPRVFGRVHPRFRTPGPATLALGTVAVVWFVAIINTSTNVLSDSITAIGFAICFYYGLTGLACVWYFRRALTKSVRNFVFAGLLPLIGALMLFGIFIKAMIFYGHQANTLSPAALGIGTPVFIGVGGLLVGVLALALAMLRGGPFYKRRRETADSSALAEPAAAGSA